MSKLVSLSLNEFVNPGVGGYSQDQLERDYHDIIRKDFTEEEFTPEEYKEFFMDFIAKEYEKGTINSEEDLKRFIHGDTPILEFEKGLGPKSALDIGFEKFTRGAQTFWFPSVSNIVSFGTGGDRIKKKSTPLKKKYWINFPELDKNAEIMMWRVEGKGNIFVDDPEKAEFANLMWTENKTKVPKELDDYLESWFIENQDYLFNNVQKSTREEFLKMITT